ncbi:C-type lectin domain family 4 member C-like [Erpetoichthys calabaricus]|uniref:C-type lectin domain family 4 member C-like n=1 Tax=Erpetoichthys calabaricus TaxID=27687 RepID=UPI0022341954|nr:C-type lectin domain family 4 member C-like [Erpetoichthys calabaricus]
MDGDVLYSSVNFHQKKQRKGKLQNKKETEDPSEDVTYADIKIANTFRIQNTDVDSKEDSGESPKEVKESNPGSTAGTSGLSKKTSAAPVPCPNVNTKACWLILLLLIILLVAALVGFVISSRSCSVCPQSSLLFDSKCYFFFTDKMNWSKSQDNCTSIRGHLAIIESKKEQEFLISNLGNKTDEEKSYWIGLSDQVTEGHFLWVDNRPQDSKGRFWGLREYDHGQEPDNWTDPVHNPAGEDCVHLNKSEHYSGWYDNNCEIQMKRICEAACN